MEERQRQEPVMPSWVPFATLYGWRVPEQWRPAAAAFIDDAAWPRLASLARAVLCLVIVGGAWLVLETTTGELRFGLLGGVLVPTLSPLFAPDGERRSALKAQVLDRDGRPLSDPGPLLRLPNLLKTALFVALLAAGVGGLALFINSVDHSAT